MCQLVVPLSNLAFNLIITLEKLATAPYLKEELEASRELIFNSEKPQTEQFVKVAFFPVTLYTEFPRHPPSRPRFAIGLQILRTSKSVVIDCKSVSRIKQPEEPNLPGLFDRAADRDRDIEALLFRL